MNSEYWLRVNWIVDHVIIPLQSVRKFAIFESYLATRAILPFLKFDWSIWIIYEWLACILIFVWFKWQPQVESVHISCIWSLLFSLFSGFVFFFFLLGIVTEICIIFYICTCSYSISVSAFQHWQTQQVLLHSTCRVSRRNSGFISICVIHFHFNYLLLDLENVSNSYLIAAVVSRREETNRITVMPFTGMARTKEEAERSMGKFILLERSYDLAISCRAINSICLLRYPLRTSHSYVEDTALLTRIKHLSVCMRSHIFHAYVIPK